MLSACGGGDDKKKAPSICKENLFFFIVCVLGSSESAPDKGQDSGTYSIDIGKDAAASGEHGEIDEYEPNNLLDNANIVIFPGGSASTGEELRLHGRAQMILQIILSLRQNTAVHTIFIFVLILVTRASKTNPCTS